MAKIDFNVTCMAFYRTTLNIPDDIAKDKQSALEYIREHLSEAPIQDLEYLADLDPDDVIGMDNIDDIYDFDEEDESNIPIMKV